MNIRRLALLAVLPLAMSCGKLFNVDLLVVGGPTALEKQVLGSYQTLGSDLLAYSSVRGVSPDGSLQVPPPTTDSQAAALRAMQNRSYNRDDVNRLLATGVLGEGRDGLLTVRNKPTEAIDGMSPDMAMRIAEEENVDRAILIERLMATVPGVRENQKGEVAWIFATLNQEAAPTGSSFQDRNGIWRAK